MSMAGLPSEKDSVALVSEMFMALPSLGGEVYTIKNTKNVSGLPQPRQQGAHVRQVDFTRRLGARQDQVHQRVVRQIQQARQRIDFVVGQAFLMRIEKAREDQIV